MSQVYICFENGFEIRSINIFDVISRIEIETYVRIIQNTGKVVDASKPAPVVKL